MPSAAAPLAIIGAGAWGTALAIHLARNGNECRLWSNEPGQLAEFARDRRANTLFPEIPFPEPLRITPSIDDALADVNDVLVAVPSQVFRPVLRSLAKQWPTGASLIWATKGLESDTGKFLHQIGAEELNDDVERAVVSGPTFASEVASGLPTALVVASDNTAVAERFARRLHGNKVRAYTSTDVPGVETGGAVKNVLAIGAGICDGLGYGANSRAALITRGLTEMMRLGEALGARQETLMGLAGVGDLILTCTDNQSRNRRMGLALGSGKPLDATLAEIGQVVEGIETARAVMHLARDTKIEMPICEQIYKVLHEGLDPERAVETLLMRSLKAENALS